MSWLGKIIGGTIGFFLGGPLGMIAGAVFGHMIDKSNDLQGGDDSQFQGSSRRFGDSDRYYFFNTGYNRSQMVFFVGAFSMLAKLASADGQISDAARRKVNELRSSDSSSQRDRIMVVASKPSPRTVKYAQ